MNSFGTEWNNHIEILHNEWSKTVSESDIVLVPGDISWATKWKDAETDLAFLSNLSGHKILLKGNHDRWWKGITSIRTKAPSGVFFINHDVIKIGDVVFGGTCLCDYPFIAWSDSFFAENLPKVNSIIKQKKNVEQVRRIEIERLKYNLAKMEKYKCKTKVFLTHFPPIGSDFRSNKITRLLALSGVTVCVYGHLHHLLQDQVPDVIIDGVRFVFVSSDYLCFKPKFIIASPTTNNIS